MKPFILFITGISTSGKSTLLGKLKSAGLDANIRFHDIDENGCPEAGKGPWRKYRVEELLFNALKNYKENVSTIISGISIPFEVIESRRFKQNINVHFLLLEVRMSDFKKRMRARLQNGRAIGPLSKIYQYNSELNKRLKIQTVNIKNGHVIKTFNKTEKEILSEAVELIKNFSGCTTMSSKN